MNKVKKMSYAFSWIYISLNSQFVLVKIFLIFVLIFTVLWYHIAEIKSLKTPRSHKSNEDVEVTLLHCKTYCICFLLFIAFYHLETLTMVRDQKTRD